MNAAELNGQLARLRAAQQRRVPDYAQRMDDLRRLRAAVKSRLDDLADAMSADFGRRSRHEALLSEGMTLLTEIDYLRANLRTWMRPRRHAADWLFFPARAEVRHQPFGVVGVITPWNYPVYLALMPLATAIAAGNHVMLKLSEHTPRTSQLLQRMLADVFADNQVVCVTGGPHVAAAFASLRFDHLFFTGSTTTGREVMAAAARNLTPVTLELGGKSPAIIAPDFPLDVAVPRIAAGKLLNAGQTCIAPDYVLLPRARIDEFTERMRAYVAGHYPDLVSSPDYTSIVNAAHYARLLNYLDQAHAAGAKLVELAHGDAGKRIMPPTLVIDANDDLAVMQEEIFGPILPLVAVESVDAAIDYVNARPRPLALYHFDYDKTRTQRVLDNTTAGGVTVNDTLLHFAQRALPFGGVGGSGMGHYHGHQGFLTFTKQKPVLYQARWSGFALLRPPYRKLADFLVRFLTR